MIRLKFLPLILLFLLAPSSGQAKNADDLRLTVLSAMREELCRSKGKLLIEGFENPYFISYLLLETQRLTVAAKYGAIIINQLTNSRDAYVDLRVGNYKFDDSEPKYGGWYQGNWPSGPIEDNPEAIKTMFWQMTDREYKNSIKSYLRKKGDLINKVEKEDRPDDFSQEEVYRFIQPKKEIDLQSSQWTSRIREISNLFKSYPWIDDADVSLCLVKTRKYFVNTEGSEYISEGFLLTLVISAEATSPDDGMPLENLRVYNVSRITDLPDQGVILQETKEMIDELQALRQAEVLLPYTGPAILGPQVTSVLFHEAVGHRLEGERQKGDEEGQTFKDKIGERILPGFINIIDDPSLEEYNGKGLLGHYLYDEQGIPAQKVILVKQGILKNYLLSRSPIKGFNKSNGHGRSNGRSAPVSRMGNFLITSESKLSQKELKKQLIEKCKKAGKPYGLIIKNTQQGFTSTERYGSQMFCQRPILVYKVNLESGTETLVRGVEIVGTPLTAINKVIACGDDYEVFNGFCNAESGVVPQSEVAPSSLSTEVELQKSTGQNRRPPLLPPPFL